MRIVLDANIVIGGLMGSRGIIVILTSKNHDFYAPKLIIDEIRKHKQEICTFNNQTEEDFEINYGALLTFINICDYVEYRKFIDEAETAIGKRDIKDAAYIACGLAVNADFIWSNDKDFQEVQRIIPIKTTDQFIAEGKLS